MTDRGDRRTPDGRRPGGLTVVDDAEPAPDAAANGETAPDDIADDEAAARLAALHRLIDMMRPAVQADGGDLVLTHVDVRTGVVDVQLQGSCSSCAISGATLEQGVERLLTQRLDWVRSVRGSVEDVDDLEASAALGRGGWQPAETVPDDATSAG